MDTMKFKFDDGEEFKLPDISSEKFDQFIWDSGSNDIAYEEYKRENGMKELIDLNSDATKELTLIVEQSWRGRVLKFKCVYDSNDDINFDENEYFGNLD